MCATVLIADALMRDKFNAIGLIGPYSEAIWAGADRSETNTPIVTGEPQRSDLRFIILRRRLNRILDKPRLPDDLSIFNSYRSRKNISGLLWSAFGISSTNIFGYQDKAEATPLHCRKKSLDP